MDMNNTTSDKNVDSIEKDIERCKQLTKSEHANWIGISNQLAITHILAELERKDKRIKEIERKYLYEKLVKEEVEELLGNSIPTRKVIDKLEELKKRYDEEYDLYMGYKVESREQQDILKQISILQELLGGGK